MGKLIAQLNETDTMMFQLRASITGNYQQGNVEVLNWRSKLDFTLIPHINWAFKSQNSSLYQSFNKVKADNDIFSRNYLYYKPTHLLYPFAIAYLSSNYRRKIESRYFVGGGITYKLITTKSSQLKVSASAVYENTKFSSANFNDASYNNNSNIQLWRGTVYLSGWNTFKTKNIKLYYDVFWQPTFNNKRNYRTQLDIGTDLLIYKGLSFTALYTFTHEQLVVNNIKQDDKILTFGIVYNLKIK
ncbi:MAG: DUF481 domain-containing protein [Sediminibacterium sp.]|nr:DUF481 domain-containing protein [Sediminibacterium sp.]